MLPGFYVYTSNRLEDLLEALAVHIGREPLPPLESETIVVPGQGLARWVQLRLAEFHGIAAGLRLPFPGAFLQQLSQHLASGPDLFAKDVLAWRLWRLLGDPALQADLGPAARYCAVDPDGRKRFQLCERLAACFDDYQLYRDDLLLRAAAGGDLADLGPHGPWQARLWRALRRDADARLTGESLAEKPSRRSKRPDNPTPWLFPELAAAAEKTPLAATGHRLQQLRELLASKERARAVLPPRLSVFGTGTLPPAFLDLLRLAAAVVPVALFVPQPTPEYVGDVRGRGDLAGDNSLLARLGTESREFADLLLDRHDRPRAAATHHLEIGTLAERNTEQERTTLLHCLQQDIAEVKDRGRPGAPPELAAIPLAADDDSLRVHDCHSPQRELEVVRDQILAAFAADPDLEPHQILVLVPDIERYAPYAHAVFGPVAEHLPFHVADRSPVSELPLCASLFAALQLAQERLQVFDVLHLLEEPAVQRRFGLFASDLPILRHLCASAGIRWGLDGAMRERQFRVPAFDENAWLPGLDRLLLGVATGPQDDLVAGLLPVADTTDGRDELLARFVHFAQALFARLQPLQRPHPLPVWADLLDELLQALYQPVSADDEAALAQVQRATANLRALANHARLIEPIAPIVLQDWLRSALQQASGARGFLAGAVTVAAMLPMRTVPSKYLFLCGLDDQSFPRRDQPAPFDLLAQQHRPGDRSLRQDDRQMFLDALLAARKHLHITFVGHSQKDDSECAPSVVLDELLDLVDRSFLPPDGFARPRDFVVVRHPLQPWSLRYRTGEDRRLFTYARDDLQRAAASATDEAPWCDRIVAPPEELQRRDLPLDRLQQFWKHPCRFFLLHTLRIRLRAEDDSDLDTEPFSVEGLDRWRLQDQLVRRVLRGDPAPRDPLARVRATGLLPVGGLGTAAFASVDTEAQEWLHEVLGHGTLVRAPLRVELPDFTIAGELEGIGDQELVLARIARLKPKDHLRGWLLHLLIAVARDQGATHLPSTTRLIGKDKTLRLRALSAAEAHQMLEPLLAGYRLGITTPLPFFENSSQLYGKLVHGDEDPETALRRARRDWLPKSPGSFPQGDSEDPDIALCFRGREPLDSPEFAAWAERIWTAAHSYTEELK